MSRFLGVVRTHGSRAGEAGAAGAREMQSGAAIVEHVLLVGLLMITFVGVLTLYTLAIKQVACERIFSTPIDGFAFNPNGATSFNWLPIGDASGCYHLDGGGLNKVF